MKDPTLSDLFGDIYDKLGSVDVEDTEFGDEDNTNVTTPIIDTLNAAVSYYASSITRIPQAQIIWSWDAPNLYDEDGNIVDPNDPDVADDINLDPVTDYMFGTSLNGADPLSFRSTNGGTSVVTEGHALGIDVTATVYAVTKSGIKGPTSQVTATVSKDTTAPGKPSDPVVFSELSTVTVTFDGKLEGGADQPIDYLKTELMAGTTNPPTERVGDFFGAGVRTFYAEAGTTIYVQLFSYDTSYNRSVGSDVASVLVKSVLDDTGLDEALSSRKRIYQQATDPSIASTVSDGDWWFESDPAAPAVVIRMWRRVAGAWEQDTIHASQILAAASIIAGQLSANSVVADNIMAGELYAKLLLTKELKADAIEAGLLKAQLTLSGVIQTASSGKRVVLDQGGITLYDANDDPITFINTDGESFFTGTVTASTLTVEGQMALNSATNVMNPGSRLTLGEGLQGPANAPTVSNVWNTLIQLKTAASANIAPVAVFLDHLGVLRSVRAVGSSHNACIHNETTGVATEDLPLTYPFWSGPKPSNLWETSFAHAGGAIYALAGSGSSTKLIGYQPSTSEWFHDDSMDVTLSGSYLFAGAPRMVVDPLNELQVIIAYKSTATDREIFRVVNISTGALVNTITNDTISTDTSASPNGFYVGNADLGSRHFIYGNASYFRFTRNSDQALVATAAFPVAAASTIAVGYSGVGSYTGFWSCDSTGKIVQHDGPTWATSALTQAYQFGYTYYNSTPYQSKVSPYATINSKKRARIKINVSGWVPGKPTAAVTQLLYYGNTSAGTKYLQGTNNTGSLTLATVATSGSTPPASTSFPDSVPADIVNGAGTLDISADGTISAVSVVTSGGTWTTVTLDTGFAHQTTQFAYMLKDGEVRFRSGVTNAGFSASTTMVIAVAGTLPVGVRPTGYTRYFSIASSNGNAIAVGVIRTDGGIEVRTSGTVGSFYIFDGARYIP